MKAKKIHSMTTSVKYRPGMIQEIKEWAVECGFGADWCKDGDRLFIQVFEGRTVAGRATEVLKARLGAMFEVGAA